MGGVNRTPPRRSAFLAAGACITAAVLLSSCGDTMVLQLVRDTVAKLTQVATPQFSPAAGTINGDQSVSISCATDGADIRYTYTTDGTAPADPTPASTRYVGPIPAAGKGTMMAIKAMATKSSLHDSEIASANYVINIIPSGNAQIEIYVGATQIMSGSGSRDMGVVYPDGNGGTAGSGVQFLVSNTGSTDLTLSSVTLSAGDTGDFDLSVSSLGPYVGGANKVLSFSFSFDPLILGRKSATVTIASNSASNNPFTFTLTGIGTPAAYVSTTGNAGNSGLLPTEPKNTVQDGIAVAQANGLNEVRVSGGTYNLASDVVFANGVSLRGGYSAGFGTRDIATYVTTLQDSRATGDIPIRIENITSPTTFEGFTVTKIVAVSIQVQVVSVLSSRNVTVERNTIQGGSTTGTGAASYGIVVDSCTSPVVIYTNVISIGDATNGYACGVRLQSSSGITFTRNSVYSAYGSMYSWGVGNWTVTSSIIANNVVQGGTSPYHSVGVQFDYSPIDLFNNTIDGGAGDTASAIQILRSAPNIRNNILMSSGVSLRRGINENTETCTPAAIRNNCFFDCTGALWTDSGSNITNLTTNGTTGEGTNTLANWGNIAADPYFVNRAGGDLHIQASSPLNVRGGGQNLLASFSNDMDNVSRTTVTPTGMTNVGAAGWSMGAYEKD